MKSFEDKTAALLASLWNRNRPVTEARLDLLEKAAASAREHALDTDDREKAADVAHQLAGSLGMYGFDHGTRLARQLELLLDYANPDPAQLVSLVAQLRQSISFPEAASG